LLLQLELLRVPIGIAGVAYLLWLAWDAWHASDCEWAASVVRDSDVRHKALRSGVLLSLTNPQNVAYWAALGSALGAVGVHRPTAVDYSVFFAGFMLSSIVWAFVFAALVDRLFRGTGSRWVRITYRVCAIAFLALALSSLRELWVSQRTPLIQAPNSTSH